MGGKYGRKPPHSQMSYGVSMGYLCEESSEQSWINLSNVEPTSTSDRGIHGGKSHLLLPEPEISGPTVRGISRCKDARRVQLREYADRWDLIDSDNHVLLTDPFPLFIASCQ